MLTTSFIFAAGLELVIIYNALSSSSWSLVWVYSILFLISLFSVHAEDSKSGKEARTFFKDIGIKSEKYDIFSNFLKIGIYTFALTGFISYYLAAALTYLVIFITVILIYTKFVDVLKEKKKREKDKIKEQEQEQEKESRKKE